MKKLLAIGLILLAAIQARPAAIYEYITGNLTVTNGSVTNDFWTVNGTTRYGGTSRQATKWQTNSLATTTASNIFSQLGSWPLNGVYVYMTSPTNVAFAGVGLTASTTNHLGFFTMTTNSVGTNRWALMAPIESLPQTQRVTNGTEFVRGINYATNTVDTNAVALSNYISTGPQSQTASNKDFNATTLRNGTVSNSTVDRAWITNAISVQTTNLTALGASISNSTIDRTFITNAQSVLTTNLWSGGGYLSNVVLNVPVVTNLSGSLKKPFVYGASGDGLSAVFTNYAAGDTLVTKWDQQDDAEGMQLQFAWGGRSPFFYISVLSNGFGIYNNSGAIISINQSNVTVGASSQSTTIGGRIQATSGLTNTTMTGTNVINGRIDFKSSANSTLANGYNTGIILGSNVYVRLSGPSGAYTNVGFTAEQDGSWHILEFDNPVNNMTILDNSNASGETAVNRIRTTTGGLLNFTNNPVTLRVHYSSTLSRWILEDGATYR
jgi:hypothetical protein